MSEAYSVVIPAYNAEKTIDACLASVFAQTLAPVQVLVIDDHSSDGTAAAVGQWKKRFSIAGMELEYFRLARNAGPSLARNQGIREANGSHIAFLDADDVWSSDKLAVIDRCTSGLGADLVFHDYTESTSFGAESNAAEYEVRALSIYNLLLRNRAQTSSVVVRRQPMLAFDESMRYCEDFDLWMRIAEHSSVLYIVGAPLTRLGRPQLSVGGLSASTVRMRIGQVRVFYNFCRRDWRRRVWLLPGLLLYSLLKHIYSLVGRQIWRPGREVFSKLRRI